MQNMPATALFLMIFASCVSVAEAEDSTSTPHESPAENEEITIRGDGETDEPIQAGELWVEPSTGLSFRLVPAGTFTMGSPSEEPGRGADEFRHQVTLSRSYWMGETEVTQAQWRAVTGDNPSFFSSCGDDCPVESVTWFEAVAFANAFSAQAGLPPCYRIEDEKVSFLGLDCRGFRLPTEAEWERAARAGTDNALYTGPLTIEGLANSSELDVIAWYGGNSGVDTQAGIDCSGWRETQHPAALCGTHPVRGKQPNQWRLHDMIGGVWEWVHNTYMPYPETAVADPVELSDGITRVARGCSWDSAAKTCRVANRSSNAPKTRYRYLGLRLARTTD